MIEINNGILKSIDSAIEVIAGSDRNVRETFYILKYKDGTIIPLDKKLFTSKGRAKSYLIQFVRNIFWHGQYWQSCENNIKNRSGYTVDFSETIKILPSYGETSKFEDPKNKKMFKEIAEKLIEKEIFKIEEIII